MFQLGVLVGTLQGIGWYNLKAWDLPSLGSLGPGREACAFAGRGSLAEGLNEGLRPLYAPTPLPYPGSGLPDPYTGLW